eukprot:617629-Amphidinium_carterae.1
MLALLQLVTLKEHLNDTDKQQQQEQQQQQRQTLLQQRQTLLHQQQQQQQQREQIYYNSEIEQHALQVCVYGRNIDAAYQLQALQALNGSSGQDLLSEERCATSSVVTKMP